MKVENFGKCKTNAMGILPHQDTDRALEFSLSLDIPFWPQLPKKNIYEDMYIQFSENFPGINIDENNFKITLNKEKFYEELPEYLEKAEDEDFYGLSDDYTLTFNKFLEKDLDKYPAIKGQIIGPISFGLKIMDEEKKPIIFHDEIRYLLFEFFREKINYQYKQLYKKHDNVMIHIDEPGLEFVFNSFSGYASESAREDLSQLLAGIEGPKVIHLCGNPDWDFLLKQDLDLLSFDAYSKGERIINYPSLAEFINGGGIVAWGIVPTHYEILEKESIESLADRLENLWSTLEKQGVERETIINNSQLTPATCSIMGAKNVETVEKAYEYLTKLKDHILSKNNVEA
ncbi:hypothetical protein [Natranaerofaba carboxydovora]|uniref:hypothetical protein n=1 Tax=Natranaerofaba carboxydovora TaxID=2742683 RepID=UPI001F1465F6|nr:hypothetical protein [Natranaerofaba carboxydovora]UMZ72755.1 hypothetical protein ACONDI_00281 [Natranaerofaba carboxydovora]